MIVLDTNVIAEVMKPHGSPAVSAWLDAQSAPDIATTTITVAEVMHGLRRMNDGRRKQALYRAATAMFEQDFAGRILPFDPVAAMHYADVVTERESAGRPISMADAQIAAIVRAYGTALATRNTRDFEGLGIDLVDPWA